MCYAWQSLFLLLFNLFKDSDVHPLPPQPKRLLRHKVIYRLDGIVWFPVWLTGPSPIILLIKPSQDQKERDEMCLCVCTRGCACMHVCASVRTMREMQNCCVIYTANWVVGLMWIWWRGCLLCSKNVNLSITFDNTSWQWQHQLEAIQDFIKVLNMAHTFCNSRPFSHSRLCSIMYLFDFHICIQIVPWNKWC